MLLRAPLLALCLSVPLFCGAKLPPPADMQVDFAQHVQPILAAKCYSCHGFKVQQSGLRLDKRQNALRGGDYGPVILQGNSAESKLIKRLVDGDGGMQMPPSGALEPEEIGILRAWIDQGADFGNVEIKEEKPRPVDPWVRELIGAVRRQDDAAAAKLLKAHPAAAKGLDSGGSTPLHHAAGFGSVAAMSLLLDAGAPIEAKNRFGHTPLHWAFADRDKTALLLERGANVNAKANDGRTALYLAASQRDSDRVLRLLLARGADPNLATSNGRTPLMAAAGGGDVAFMQLLLDAKADVNAASGTGSTALMDAASSGNVQAVRLLMRKGADINAHTKKNQTALAVAAMYGSEDMAKELLDAGADVAPRDERGYSALMYAAYAETLPAGMVRMLLEKGADRSVSGEGETPVTLAGKRGGTEVARLLGVPEEIRQTGGVAGPPEKLLHAQPRQAVEKALDILAMQSPVFVRKSGCNSCHNQYLPAAALGVARDHGISGPQSIVMLSQEMAERHAERAMDMSVAAIGSVGYELFGFSSLGRPADEYTDAVVHYVKAMQTPEGNWQTTGTVRPPLTSDDFITAAMAINILRVYGRPAEKADTEARIARAAAWLRSNSPRTTQERAFQLLGTVWANGDSASVAEMAKSLAGTQRADGGWAQLPSMGSDAYATGEALYALRTAGRMAVDDPVYASGVKYLLKTQAADGSWHVRTRSIPVQPYFQTGFPYEHDQWISAAGTSWAAMALSLTLEPAKLSRLE